MQFSVKNFFQLLSYVSIILFSACGMPLPIQEMAKAKQEISRAEVYRADEFAKTEYDEARKGLFNAHNFAAEDNTIPAEAKSAAEYAVARAYDAMEKALPRLCSKTRDDASKAIEDADVAFAVNLAQEEFNRSVQLRKDGDAVLEEAEKLIGQYPKESDAVKKHNTRMAAFDVYEKGYKKYEEARESAEKAKNLALSQKNQLLDSIAAIEEDLTLAEKYSEGGDPRIPVTRGLIEEARKNIEEGKIKDGFWKLENARKETAEIVAASIKKYAAKRRALADEKIKDAEKNLDGINKEFIEKDAQGKSSSDTARENLTGAKEALKSADDYLNQEKYNDSIKQSDEAIRIAEIVAEQNQTLLAMASNYEKKKKSSMRDANINIDGGDDEEAGKSDKDAEDADGKDNLGEGWKVYVVKKKVPSDCLWRISGYKEHYNNPRLWTRIYKANKAKIKNPDLIFPKQRFDIPPMKGDLKKPAKRDKDIADEKTKTTDKKPTREEKKDGGDDQLDSTGDEDSPQNK